MRNLLIGLLLFLTACNSGSSGGSNSNQPPIGSSWTQFFGYGVNIDSTGSFDFPSLDGVHYIAKPSGRLTLGQTVTLKFQITGSGTWGISDQTDTLPPHIHLFLWESGDDGTGQGAMETYREWCGYVDITSPGSYTVTCKLDPTLWTGVFGQTPSAAAFQQLLNSIYGVGFTFGGKSYSGHGIYSATGKFHFTFTSYTIQ